VVAVVVEVVAVAGVVVTVVVVAVMKVLALWPLATSSIQGDQEVEGGGLREGCLVCRRLPRPRRFG